MDSITAAIDTSKTGFINTFEICQHIALPHSLPMLHNKTPHAYDVEDSLMRFNACYELIDQADYVDILFVISHLKELDYSAEIGGILSKSFQAVFLAIKHLFGSKSIRRCNYLLDLLEEAKERKRPT